LPPGAGGKVDFPLLYEKSDTLAAGRSAAGLGPGGAAPQEQPAAILDTGRVAK
jgi:hypothetical protein